MRYQILRSGAFTLLSIVSLRRVRSSMAASQFCIRISEASLPHREFRAFLSVDGTLWTKNMGHLDWKLTTLQHMKQQFFPPYLTDVMLIKLLVIHAGRLLGNICLCAQWDKALPLLAWLQWHCCTAQSLFLFILDKLIKLCHPKGMGLDRNREMDHERLFSFSWNRICCTFRYDSQPLPCSWPYSLKITRSNKNHVYSACATTTAQTIC